MEKQSDKILIFCDGASKGNPGPGGWGAVVATPTRVVELGGREERTTNNQMELRAALEALTHVSRLSAAPVIVHTDSSYVINGITKWVHGWKQNGWKTKEKKEVLNKKLWVALDAAVFQVGGDIEWQQVGGHVGVLGNERADTIASDFAENKKVSLYIGPRRGYSLEVHNIARDESLHKLKSDSRAHSKGKAYSYVSRVDGTIAMHKTWAECEARVRGKSARYKKALSAEDEAQIIKDFSSKK